MFGARKGEALAFPARKNNDSSIKACHSLTFQFNAYQDKFYHCLYVIRTGLYGMSELVVNLFYDIFLLYLSLYTCLLPHPVCQEFRTHLTGNTLKDLNSPNIEIFPCYKSLLHQLQLVFISLFFPPN